MNKIPVGLQLYSIRDECARDLPGMLQAVARMGYDGVEFAGYHDFSAQDMRKMLDDLGLRCCGTHIGLETMLGDQLEKTIEYNLTIGNPYLIVPGMDEKYRNSLDAWRRTAALFGEIAEKVAAHGLRVGYHNHHVEFEAMDGQTPLEVFFTAAPANVLMQLDIGNGMEGGYDVVSFLRRHAARAATVHCKEFSRSNPEALVGEGDVPWVEVFDICAASGGSEWYIVEQESYAFPPLECVERCLVNMKRLLG